MTTVAVTPQIEGLPPGAILRPMPQAQAAPASGSSAQPPIEGLPPGAIVKPIGNYSGTLTSTGIAAPQGTSTASEAWDALKQTGKDLATGASQGAANTVGSSVVATAKLLNKIPGIGKYLAPKEGINALADMTARSSAPENTTQAVGKGGEQVGEFLLPGAGEEEAVAHALPFLSKLGPLAKPLARIGYQTGTSAAMNAAQGGSATTGAGAGAVGGAVGEGLRAVAPAMAESALGITKRMRGYGKTPGVAALEETSALRPAAIERQAQQKLGDLSNQIQSAASAHPGTISLQPALDTIDQQIAKATAENNGQAVAQLQNVRDAISKNMTTQTPLAVNQPAAGALNLKRGLRNQFVKNWNPDLMSGTRAVAARASGAIDSELDNALGPEFESANRRASSLIPVAERAESLERDPGVTQRVGNRIAAHTGALAGSALGGAEGYRERGLPGAIVGGTAGLVLPEIFSSPSAKMAAARILYKPGTLIKLLSGAGLQLDRD